MLREERTHPATPTASNTRRRQSTRCSFSLVLINAIGALVFALPVPYIAIGRTPLYFDLQAKAAEAPAKRWRERLPRRAATAEA
jgi:hypothetical protein